ncbi:MAG: hypothetical protein AABX16_02975 [Nanoarchaeota archaeon]
MVLRCSICDREFNSQESLSQHAAAKHSDSQTRAVHTSSKISIKTYIIIAVLVLVIVGGYQWYNTREVSSNQYDTFAQCLTEKGALFYGTFWCPHCKEQKKMFGNSIEYVSYIECSTPDGNSQLPVCAAAGIEGYPTWKFADGSELSGKQSFETLSKKTGCAILPPVNITAISNGNITA